MPSPSIVATPADVIWGSDNVYSGARVIRGSRRASTFVDDSLDNNGIPTGAVLIPEKKRFNVTIEVLSSTTLPTVGSSITLFGESAYVESVEDVNDRRGRKQATIEGFSFPA